MSYIVRAFDFHDAISTPGNRSVDITKVEPLTDKISIVSTNVGKFWCESMEIDDTIFIKVTSFYGYI